MQNSAPTGLMTHQANQILAALPAEELERLKPHLESVTLPVGFDLYAVNTPIEHVHFVHSGVASLVTPMENGESVEIATIGPEGMVGMPVFLGDQQTASRGFIQVAGDGARMTAAAFRALLPLCPILHGILLRYTLALMNQIAQNAACNRTHSVEERCARWLLMTHDRVRAPSFYLTQEFLGQMLGVRRPTVWNAASMLGKAGFISYVRGEITILDRAGLESASCDCYRVIAGEFERLVGRRR